MIDRPSTINNIKVWIINLSTFHHRVMARFLRRRGWVVFYLDERARKCTDDFCWLKLYSEEEG